MPLLSLSHVACNIADNSMQFLTDRNRIIFSSAFRRLEYKTQVFVNHSGDHYRTRLTHSLEVASVAKLMARKLHINEDLAETIALAHDLGHPPFGHAGEEGLNEASYHFGGFDHNFNTLKIIASLNDDTMHHKISSEAIDGIIKHNGQIDQTSKFGMQISQLFPDINLTLDKMPSLEAQIASLSDDIVYCAHDIEDGLRAGFITFENIKTLPIIQLAIKQNQIYQDNYLHIAKAIRGILTEDLLQNTFNNINAYCIKNLEDIKNCQFWTASFSSKINSCKNELKQFLTEKVYRHHAINRMRYKAKILVKQLFDYFMQHSECLPETWRQKTQDLSESAKATIIIDYIAGMTDRFAIDEHNRLFDFGIL